MDEGYIKYNCNWIKDEPISKNEILEINKWRDRLYNVRLIGAYKDGTGYGNISIRFKGDTFLITGSATGILSSLNGNHYTLVNEYNFKKNSLKCTGPVKASSESLTHAAIYNCSPDANAVIHIHSIKMWDKLMDKVPTTDKHVPYGTPEMILEIKRLFIATTVYDEKLIVMGGHEEGIIAFGKTLDEAGDILIKKYSDYSE